MLHTFVFKLGKITLNNQSCIIKTHLICAKNTIAKQIHVHDINCTRN